MRKTTLAMLLLCSVALLGGCKTASVNTPPAPGYNNATDQQIGEIINSGTVFYRTIQCETQGKNYNVQTQACVADASITAPLALSPTEKASFNGFGIALNAAKTVYAEYHAGTATLAQAQAAATNVTTQQTALQSSIPGVK